MLPIYSLLSATALSAPFVQAVPAQAQTGQEAPSRRARITVTTILNGAPAGEVPIEVGVDGSDPRVAAAPLLAKLEGVLAPSALSDLRAQLGTTELVSIAEFANSPVRVSFNMAELRLYVDVSVASRSVNDLSIVAPPTSISGEISPPSDFSAGLTFNLANRFRHENNFGDIHRDPFNVLAQGFVNWGGVDGVNLLFEAGYQERGQLTRGRTTLFHDDVARAIRYSVGDIDPQYFGSFANNTSILGLGVERLYETIQPFRNIRPSGQGRLTLETPSRVDVIVNGAVYRTLDLAPGLYNLRDFPYLDGVNDVRLVVRDAAGREETIVLSFFSDAELLEPGVSIFSATFGVPRDRFGSFQVTSYRDEAPMFSGFYQRGLTSGLTVGAAAQFDKDNALLTGQTILGTSIGTFVLEGALDVTEGERAESAVSAAYRLRTQVGGDRILNIDFDLRHVSPHFAPMAPGITANNPYSLELNGRVQAQLTDSTFFNLSAGYSVGRSGAPDRSTVSAGLTRRFGRFNVGLNYSYRKDPTRTEHRGVLSLSIPLSSRQYARASYETERNRFSASYDLQAFEALGETEVHATAARSDDGFAANAEVTHYSNRFRADLRHSYDDTGGAVRQFTDAAVSFGIGYANGQVALGRDAYPGFVMVERHRTLRDSTVLVSDSFSEKPVAKADDLGPALVRVRRPYQPTSVRVTVENLPAGYDIGAGRFDIVPGATSGYHFRIGSAASNTVIGRLQGADGAPLTFVAGTLEPISGGEAAPAQFFTNRNGRMVATRVAPGRYRVMLNGEAEPIGEIEVPQDPKGPVDIGMLRRRR